jgi:SAM-dependent methyltransferase
MPVDEIFANPRLAAVYDLFDDDRRDLDAYVAIADELGAETVLDVGCGTGSLAALLAAGGWTVIGVDPAEASLAVARAKDPQVRWLRGDAAALPPVGADLAVMTGNVAMVFLGDDEWARVLRSVHRALRPGGSFVFETRRPERRDWETWAGDSAPVRRDDVESVFQLTDVSPPYVSFRATYHFADGPSLTSDSTLRFRGDPEIRAALATAGFEVLDVRDAPDRPGLELVFVTRRLERFLDRRD